MNEAFPSSQRRGAFVTLEGGEGAGKTTQQRFIVEKLRALGLSAIATREPGGSPQAEVLREALLSGKIKPLGGAAEAIVFSAARIDHIETTINPALDAGTWVICDRFADSTRAYQGAVGVDPTFLRQLERVTLDGLRPDLTFILDLPPEIGLSRANARRAPGAKIDRFESETIRFHELLREGYLRIAKAEPGRCIIVNALQGETEVATAIWDAIVKRLLTDGKQFVRPRDLRTPGGVAVRETKSRV